MKLKRSLICMLVAAVLLALAPASLAAELAPMETYTVRVSASPPFGGVAEGDGTYPSGEVVIVYAEPAEGYIFSGWRDEKGDIVSRSAVYSFFIEEDTSLEAVFEEKTGFLLTLSALPPAGGTLEGDRQYNSGEKATVTAHPAAGYAFVGWRDETGDVISGENPMTFTVSRDMHLTAVFEDTTIAKYTLTYVFGNDAEPFTEQYTAGTEVTLSMGAVRQNYTFTGWYPDTLWTERVTTIRMTGDTTVYAGWRAITPKMLYCGDRHIAYISGYPDGTVKPQNNITRAETAAIFYRLLDDNVRKASQTSANKFSDVGPNDWFNTEVSTLSRLGIIKGYSDGTFLPDKPITRAEFAAIITRFAEDDARIIRTFSDIDGHWAKDSILDAAGRGWINGYSDGSFKPDKRITRAEAITIVNRVMGRVPTDGEAFLEGMKTWPDNLPGQWYYLAIQEATTGHEWKSSQKTGEIWTKLLDA